MTLYYEPAERFSQCVVTTRWNRREKLSISGQTHKSLIYHRLV